MVTVVKELVRRVARFSGAYNRTKSKAFIVLYLHKIKGIKQGLDCLTISKLAGVSRIVVTKAIRKWTKWQYVNRKLGLQAKGRPAFTYTISQKGIRYVTEVMPPEIYDKYLKEIQEHQKGGKKDVH
jgi:predicted transcriptional regulator